MAQSSDSQSPQPPSSSASQGIPPIDSEYDDYLHYQAAKSPFELVHTDVWSPCRIAFILGFQYFVTFIDDYSRCTWLFLMNSRVELYSIFQKFYVEIQTQFNIFICVLQSDNAREYFSAPFISFMSQHVILHQSSCVHTQQNRVVERKNRHLVETARTLLFHCHVPFRF